MSNLRSRLRTPAVAGLAAALACVVAAPLASAARGRSWADSAIRAVTHAGVLGSSPGTFRPDAPLTQLGLATAIAAIDRLQHPPQPPAPPPPQPPPPSHSPPVQILSTPAAATTVTGPVDWQVDAANLTVQHVSFTLDGQQIGEAWAAPWSAPLDTSPLADGFHRLTVEVAGVRPADPAQQGVVYVATWRVSTLNAPGTVAVPISTTLAAVPIAHAPPPLAPAPVPAPVPAPAQVAPTVVEAPQMLYRAAAPGQAVTVKQLDAALVGYLHLGDAARAVQATLLGAGLRPPASTGSEAVARMLELRLNHPSADDRLELLPNQPATRAEAAWSFARVLQLGDWQMSGVAEASAAFTLPTLTPWQRRILTTAISYVGYPYVWGGTSPGAETEFGVPAAGGFDCSGFVWRVYKLTSYAGEGRLAGVLRGRTTYQMSGEVGRSARIRAGSLQPGDVMFFGHGPRSKPAEVDHTGIYLGNGWFVHSSDQGVTLLPFEGWYRESFAWARRPLREAGLA